ncbi:MAG: hypothetical protein NVS1B4_15130 [Gemmatimonadaceae bacterium]
MRHLALRSCVHGLLARLAPLLTLPVIAAMGFPLGRGAHGAAPLPGHRIEVLFLGHESNHHPSKTYAPMLVKALAGDGINFSYTTDPNALEPGNLAHYDAVLLYANHDSITPAQERALLDFVAGGKGFLAIHSASHCFRNSPRYIHMIGGQFEKHDTGTFTATIVAPGHPVMKGLTPFATWDETYIHKNNNPDRTVLQERVDGSRREPWTWVRTEGKGRVFYTAYGHDERTWKQPAFHALIRNGILWSVGETVRAEWARLRIPPLIRRETSLIPNYERRLPPPQYQEPLSPEASMLHSQVPPGFELKLFASETQIGKPIAMAWDERGRLWIAESADYPNNIHPGAPGTDRIKILEDTDGDGRADKITIFADSLNMPTGLVLANDGVIVAAMPNLLFLKDTTGDDRADVRQVILTGWGTSDTHAGPSNLRYGFDNYIWGAVGYSAYRGVVNGDSLRFGQALYRLRPDGTDLEHVASFTNNTWGLGFSETFDIFGSTANNAHAMYVGIPHRYQRGVKGLAPRFGSAKIDGHYAITPLSQHVRQVDVQGGFTAAAGFNLYTARTYPREYWNRVALVSEPTGRLLHRAVLEKQGAGFIERDGWNLFASDDDWVAPVDAQVGPDGAVWMLDFYNFIVQHNPTPPGFKNGKGNAYITPLRDTTRGRIYRLINRGAAAAPRMTLRKDRPDDLVKALTNDNLFWRLTAQRLLVERRNADVAPRLYALARRQEVDDMGLSPGALHALWTLHGLGLLDGRTAEATAVAVAALRHPAAGVRKAAVQVLPPTATTLQAIQAAGLLEDRDPHTRLAAVLFLTQLAPSNDLGATLYGLGKSPDVASDIWLSDAVYVAAAHHRAGYFKAYAADVGDESYRRIAQRIAREEADPSSAPASPRTATALGAPPPRPLPVAERLLRAYIEDIVGPITRPPPVVVANGAASEPALELQISVIPGQLKFSVPAFTIKAGRRLRLTVSNTDQMPHNLVVARPGTLESVGALADAMVRTPDAADRGYIPPTPDVVFSTKLLDPGESFTLDIVAPRQAGEYPYLCSFPGHWRVMQGKMTVVE